MARLELNRSLDKMRTELEELGNCVLSVMNDTINVLETRDIEKARQIIDHDEIINEMTHNIEQSCMYTITRQQPIARDLRFITSTLKSITDIERMGDQCADICEIVWLRSKDWIKGALPYNEILVMFREARDMYESALKALIEVDEILAEKVCKHDDIVDKMFNDLAIKISGAMAKNAEVASEGVDAIMIIKYVERLADHATNVAEWAIYLESGKHQEF